MERVLSTRLVADVGGYTTNMATAENATTRFANNSTSAIQRHSREMTQAGMAAAAMGAAIGLALRAAARDQIAFESSLTKIVTLVGVSKREVDAMGQSLLRLTGTGRGPLELADAMFFVQSAGLRGAAAMDVVEESAKAASIGLGETKVVADLATSAMNAYGAENLSASEAIDIMIGAVREGKAEADDLAGVLGNVLPIAAEMGVTFEEVGASVAAMTRTGTNAATATTQLRAILVQLLNPAQHSQVALEGVGLSAQMLRDTIQQDGLWAALMMLREAVGDNQGVLAQIIPNVRALAGFLDLTGANAEANAEIFANMNETMGLGAEAFDEWGNISEAALARFSAAMEAARISSMEGLSTVLVPIMDMLTDMIEGFIELPAPVRAAITSFAVLLAILGVVGGGFLILLPRIVATRIAMQTLAVASPRAAAGMRVLGASLGFVGAVLALVTAFELLDGSMGKVQIGAGTAREALFSLQQGGTHELINSLRELHGQLEAADRLWGPIPASIRGWNMSGREAAKVNNEWAASISAVDTELAALVAGGDVDTAARTVRALGRELGLSGDEMRRFVEEHLPEYVDALKQSETAAAEAAAAIDPMEQKLLELGARFGLTGEDAITASQQLLGEWTNAATSFIDIKGAFDLVLDGMTEKQREAAEAAAEAAGESAAEWEKFKDDFTVTAKQVNDELQNQIDALDNWSTNLAILVARGVDEALYDELVRLGPEGAAIVQAYVNGTDEELQRANELWSRRTGEGADSITTRLAMAQPVLRRIAEDMGIDVALNIAKGMADNKTTVEQEAHRQGVAIDRVLDKYGEAEITPELNRRALSQVGRSLDNLAKDRTMRITATLATQAARSGGSQGVNIGQREFGGPVVAGQPYIVGEKRPELFVPETNGRIVPRVPSWWNSYGGSFGYRQQIVLKDEIDATDFNNLLTNAAARAVEPFTMSGSGKVLPPGSYRIGRGPAGHGYNARDLPAPTGTSIFAGAAGIVSRALRWGHSYGIHAAINHGGWRTLYAHMSQLFVRLGQEVQRGQLIGRVGSTGNSTGPHLHLEPDLPRLYDLGGIVRPGITTVMNGTGGDEVLLNNHQASRILLDLANRSFVRGGDGAAIHRYYDSRELTATARIDLGEGIERVFTLKFERDSRKQAKQSDLIARTI